MKQYNLEAPEDFRELEILAYNGAVPLARLPGAAYKYFAELEKVSRLYRQGSITQQELQSKRRSLLISYRQENDDAKYYRQIISVYNSNIKAAGSYITAIEKAKTASDIIQPAVRCIEAMIGEAGFAARQMRKLKEEGKNHDT